MLGGLLEDGPQNWPIMLDKEASPSAPIELDESEEEAGDEEEEPPFEDEVGEVLPDEEAVLLLFVLLAVTELYRRYKRRPAASVPAVTAP